MQSLKIKLEKPFFKTNDEFNFQKHSSSKKELPFGLYLSINRITMRQIVAPRNSNNAIPHQD